MKALALNEGVSKSKMRKAPGLGPCAFLDVVEGKKGYRIALFDPKTDVFRYYLVSSGGVCATSKDLKGATVYRTMRDVEDALNRCGKEPCPPCACEGKK